MPFHFKWPWSKKKSHKDKKKTVATTQPSPKRVTNTPTSTPTTTATQSNNDTKRPTGINTRSSVPMYEIDPNDHDDPPSPILHPDQRTCPLNDTFDTRSIGNISIGGHSIGGYSIGGFSMGGHSMGGGCFSGDCVVSMADGSFKPALEVRSGDKVLCLTTPSSTATPSTATVHRVLITPVPSGCKRMAHFPATGLVITRFHPIVDPTTGKWAFPSSLTSDTIKMEEVSCTEIYTFLLERDSIHHSVVVNNMVVATLGGNHGLQKTDVRFYPVWGDWRLMEELMGEKGKVRDGGRVEFTRAMEDALQQIMARRLDIGCSSNWWPQPAGLSPTYYPFRQVVA
ncbi:hypothetical protein HDV00_003573 [Rhizophlyctis rosea]|nr:hypothetical protein HDV00_003573 [Rhizophlyctis rosea]